MILHEESEIENDDGKKRITTKVVSGRSDKHPVPRIDLHPNIDILLAKSIRRTPEQEN